MHRSRHRNTNNMKDEVSVSSPKSTSLAEMLAGENSPGELQDTDLGGQS